MQPLFGEEGMRCLKEFIRDGVLCAFDFDGTLAPIVESPEQASLPEDIRQKLVSLARRARVAVITGRSVDDIRARLGFEPAYVVGNHGLEGIPDPARQGGQYHETCRAWLRQLGPLERRLGVQIEDKTYSLSVHYRRAPDPVAAADRLREELPTLHPAPRIVEGKFVFNLLPTQAVDKGQAIARLIEDTGGNGAIYVGDDVTDEDVFRMRRRDILSIRVEAAEHSAADFFLPAPGDIVRLLDLMIDAFDALREHTSDCGHAIHQ
jgi:trehalose 6-phosphate phosphatase